MIYIPLEIVSLDFIRVLGGIVVAGQDLYFGGDRTVIYLFLFVSIFND